MEYEITITKREPNPKWKAEPPDYHSDYYVRQDYQKEMMGQSPYLVNQVLHITVDEQTFEAIRKAAVETL